jgi:hypothetical protein
LKLLINLHIEDVEKGPKCHTGHDGVAIRGSTGSPP